MDTQSIRSEYYKKIDSCELTTPEIWDIQEEIRDILFKKGYDLINFCNAPCRYGHFNAIDCYSTVASKLATQIQKNGYEIIVRKNPEKPSITWIIFPFNLCHEIRSCVETFEVN